MEQHECTTAIWEYQDGGKWNGYFRIDQPRSTYEQSLFENQPMSPASAFWVYCRQAEE